MTKPRSGSGRRAKPRPHPRMTGHDERINSLAVSPDGHTVASGDGNGVNKLWDVTTGAEKFGFKAHHFWVTALAFAPDGETLISGGADFTVKLWDWKKLSAPAGMK